MILFNKRLVGMPGAVYWNYRTVLADCLVMADVVVHFPREGSLVGRGDKALSPLHHTTQK